MHLLPTLLYCVAALIALGIVSLGAQRAIGRALAYGGTFLACAVLLISAVTFLGSARGEETVILPIGLPWLGGPFPPDALSAFFLLPVALARAAPRYFDFVHRLAEP